MICALLENSASSAFSAELLPFPVDASVVTEAAPSVVDVDTLPASTVGSVFLEDVEEVSFPSVDESVGVAAEEATSFLTSVLANRTVLSWIFIRTWSVHVASDHN